MRPFNPAAVPFYYGWIAAAAGILGVVFSIPGQTVGVSVFTDHLIAALSLSRTGISAAYLVGTLTSALLMTRAGRLIDRFGVRGVTAAATVFLALALAGLTRVDSAASSLAALAGGGLRAQSVAGFFVVSLGFLGIRFFGQGVLTLASRTMVMRWFDRRRGRVAAWLGVAVAAGFSYAPRAFHSLVEGQGWRGAWLSIAAGLLLAALPVVLVFFRDSPERSGMAMEQGLKPLKASGRRHDRQGPDATLAEARRDPQYWAYGILLGWWSMYGTGFTFHVIDVFASRGAGAAAAVGIFLPITFVSVAANFLGSWVSDAIDLPPLFYLAAAGILAVGISMIGPAAPWSRVVLISGYGVISGLWSVLSNLAWPRLFGRRHLGEISGSAMAFAVAGSAVGPWLFSLLRSEASGYIGAGILAAAGALALAGFGLFAFRRR